MFTRVPRRRLAVADCKFRLSDLPAHTRQELAVVKVDDREFEEGEDDLERCLTVRRDLGGDELEIRLTLRLSIPLVAGGFLM